MSEMRSKRIVCAVAVVGLFLMLSPTGHASADATPGGASASIIQGSPARISRAPWQVAIALNFNRFTGTSRDRTFCGGVALAPYLVLTARHCVAGKYERWPRNLVIYAGRTWINDSFSGSISFVSRIVRGPGPFWDVALLRLRQPVAAQPVRLASRSEYNVWEPGQVAYSTGWGSTRYGGPAARRLQISKQVILPDGVCKRDSYVRNSFRPRLMVCHGSPNANSGTCYGDSGGPLVVPVRTSQGPRYRLVGLTFYGSKYCLTDHPSVASRVSGDRLRNWILGKAGWLSSENILGSGAKPTPHPDWCQVPEIKGLLIPTAKKKLREAGCFGARIEYESWFTTPRPRVMITYPNEGWLLYPAAKFEVWASARER